MATSGKCHFLPWREVEWNRVELSGTKGSWEPRVQHELGCMSYPVDLFFVECLCRLLSSFIQRKSSSSIESTYVAYLLTACANTCYLSPYSSFIFFSSCQVHHTWHRPQDSSLFTHVVLCFLPSHFLNFILKKFQVCLVVLTILTDWKYRISGQDKKNHTKHDK